VFRRVLFVFWLVFGPAAVGAGTDVAEAWELVGRHLPNDALLGLRKNRAQEGREKSFAEAVMRMDSQPVTEAGLQQVEGMLSELARGDDEIADASAYLVGRLYQAHFFTPDFPRAAREYVQLAEKHPASYWAQLGLVKLALLKLYVLPDPAAPVARIAAAEALLPRVTFPELQRDLHIVLGRGRLFHEQPMDGVLAHLIAADRLGRLPILKEAELLLQIGELSRRERHWDQAVTYFQRFITENEVDPRVYTVKGLLADIATERAKEARP